MAKSIADKFKEAGVDASRGTITFVDPEALRLITDDQAALYEPRIEEPLDEAMVLDIMARGVLEPILVRDNGVDQNNVPIFEVICGNRRTLHLREANRRRADKGEAPGKVGMITVYGDDADMLLLRLSENAHRKEESIRTLAWKIRAVIRLGKTSAEVGVACAMSEKRVETLLTFLNLHKTVQMAIETREVPIGSIETIAQIPREEQEAALAQFKEAGATKNHEIHDAVKAIKNGHAYVAPDRKKAWGRKELKLLKDELSFYEKKSKEIRIAVSLIDFILGDNKALGDLECLKLAVSSVRRKLRRNLVKDAEAA